MATTKRPGFRVSDEFIAQHPEADPSTTELVINLLTTGALVAARLDDLLRPHGLSTSTFNLLQILDGADESLTPSDIAAQTRVPVRTATMTGLLDTCQKRGLVSRRPHPDDRRRVLVDITASGRALLAEVVPLVIEHEQRWVGHVPDATRRQLVTRLGELQDHLVELAEE